MRLLVLPKSKVRLDYTLELIKDNIILKSCTYRKGSKGNPRLLTSRKKSHCMSYDAMHWNGEKYISVYHHFVGSTIMEVYLLGFKASFP